MNYWLQKVFIVLCICSCNVVGSYEIGNDQKNATVETEQIQDIQALFDYEQGVAYYKDLAISVCFVEKIPHESAENTAFPTITIPITKHVPGHDNFELLEPVTVTNLGAQFCEGLPILSINALAEYDLFISDPRKSHVRNKRQSNGYYRSSPVGDARAQSSHNAQGHGSQAQVQGQVFGRGVFSGQAQSQNGGLSQSQVQLAGVGISGQISSSSGNAQAQLALGSGTGSGQASGLGQGPSGSQVQVTLGQEGQESMASASATSGGTSANVGNGYGGYGGAGGRGQSGSSWIPGTGYPQESVSPGVSGVPYRSNGGQSGGLSGHSPSYGTNGVGGNGNTGYSGIGGSGINGQGLSSGIGLPSGTGGVRNVGYGAHSPGASTGSTGYGGVPSRHGGGQFAQSGTPGAYAATYGGTGQAQAQTVYFGNMGNGNYAPTRHAHSSQPGGYGGGGTAGQRQQTGGNGNGGRNGYATGSGTSYIPPTNGHAHNGARNGYTPTYTNGGSVTSGIPTHGQVLSHGTTGGGTNGVGINGMPGIHQLQPGGTGVGGTGTVVSPPPSQTNGGGYDSSHTLGPAGLGFDSSGTRDQPLTGPQSSLPSGQPANQQVPSYTNGGSRGHPSVSYLPGSSPLRQPSNGRNGHSYTNGYNRVVSNGHQGSRVPNGNGQAYRVNEYGQVIPASQSRPSNTGLTNSQGADQGFSPSYGITNPSSDDPNGKNCTIITFSCTIVIESNGRAKICKPNAVRMNGNGNGNGYHGNGGNGNGGNGSNKICCC